MPINLELKARDANPQDTLRRAVELGATDNGLLQQRDTYFAVRHGRLKLREQRGQRPQLIAYTRTGPAGSRTSEYHVVDIDDAPTALAALGATCGILHVVEKTRRLLLWRTVRIHLDEVADQGRFVELEAVGGDASEFAHVRTSLAIEESAVIDRSYGPVAA